MAFETNTSCGGTLLATFEGYPYPCDGTAWWDTTAEPEGALRASDRSVPQAPVSKLSRRLPLA